MTNREYGDTIELTAVDPSGALACDTSVATPAARDGLGTALRAHLREVRPREDGVEVHFCADALDAVRRYVDLESQCCSFLNLRLEPGSDSIVLTVTGRPEAKPWIDQIFA